jgi:hypothetical protein
MLVLVATMAVPMFAAPPGDDSPIGGIERTFTRIVKQIVRILHPTDLPLIGPTKP